MKKTIFTICVTLFCQHFIFGQATPKVAKEELLKDKDHDKSMYMIVFKDGCKGKLCQSPDGQWWVHFVIGKDKGPFTKQEALVKLYEIDKKGSEGMQKLGAVMVGGPKKKILVDSKGNKYYMENGKKVYVK
jgi:hypothetical protein